jgi:pyruvate dehydrogenase (quinone)
MNGLAELITIKHYWQQWSDPRLVIAVLHNNDLNQVTWEMRAMEGAPKFVKSQTLPSVDYAGFAASLGLQGIAVDKPDDIGPAWDRALAATGRRCWTCTATRTCRRSRHMRRSIR